MGSTSLPIASEGGVGIPRRPWENLVRAGRMAQDKRPNREDS